VKITINLFPTHYKNFFVEYFSETNEILIGSSEYNSKIYISECSIDLQCTEIKEIQITEKNLIFNGVNLVIPSNKNNYYIIAF
jgi:hypothetical protein